MIDGRGMMNLLIENDGIDHINVYSQGKTELGKFLSNFTRCKLYIEGKEFQSVEAYYYYLLSDQSKKSLKKIQNLYGVKAKYVGREIKIREYSDELYPKLKEAISRKIAQSTFYREFTNSKLPFKHYYVYGDEVIDRSDSWFVRALEDLRYLYNRLQYDEDYGIYDEVY